MTLLVIVHRGIPIMAILLGIFLAMICLGLPLAKYKGHWSQWSVSSRTWFLLLFASVFVITIMCWQYIIWSSTSYFIVNIY